MIKLLNYYLFIVINCQNVCQNLTHFLSQFDTNFWCQNLTSNFDEFEPQICQILTPICQLGPQFLLKLVNYF